MHSEFGDNIYNSSLASVSTLEHRKDSDQDLATLSPTSPSNQIAVIDSAIDNFEALITNFEADQTLILYDNEGINQITDFLYQQKNPVEGVHIFAHGSAGSLQLGNNQLNTGLLSIYADDLTSWSNVLADNADILLYGCNVAQGSAGKAFVQQLSQLTEADIAASSDSTGHSGLGGDWDLEFETGSIETLPIFSETFSSLLEAGGAPNASTYVLTSQALSWVDAQAEAVSLGGNLVTINDAAEETLLKTTFGTSQKYWIGINDVQQEGQFVWANGEAVTYTNWAPGEPNNWGNAQHYGLMNFGANKQWDDAATWDKAYGIIEIPGSDTGTTDNGTTGDDTTDTGTTGDGTTGDGTTGDGTTGDGTTGDGTTGDGTTGDGTTGDGTTGDGTTGDGTTGNTAPTYVLTSQALSWVDAQAEAVSLGGHLVTINNAAEEALLKETFGTGQKYWIGINDVQQEGQFVWANGEAVTYTNWAPGEPNNWGNAQNYGLMNFGGNKQWDDAGAWDQAYGIIEIPGSDTGTTDDGTTGDGTTGDGTTGDGTTGDGTTGDGTTGDGTTGDGTTGDGTTGDGTTGDGTTGDGTTGDGTTGDGTTGDGTTGDGTTGDGTTGDGTTTGNGTTGNTAPTYVLTSQALSWVDAQAEAVSLGGHLVTINNAAEEALLKETFGTGQKYWIGINDVQQEGQFVWANGEAVTYTNWAPGEPNNWGNAQNYGLMNFGGNKQWDDAGAWDQAYGIIEIPGSDTGTTDDGTTGGGTTGDGTTGDGTTGDGTTGDGTTGDGTTGDGTTGDGTTGDGTTGDGTTGDGTTGDGTTGDGTTGDGTTGDGTTGNTAPTYVLTSQALSWVDAQAEAVSLGGHLVTINNAAEEDLLQETFGTGQKFWIGINDVQQEGQFEWVNGEAVTYTNWAPGEPNNWGNVQDYGLMNFGGNLQWDDGSPGDQLYGIIEIPGSGTGVDDGSTTDDGTTDGGTTDGGTTGDPGPISNLAIEGNFSAPITWPSVAIHAGLTPDGKVLTYGLDGNYTYYGGSTNENRNTKFVIWDPKQGTGEAAFNVLPMHHPVDNVFCSGMILLPESGQMLIAGGSIQGNRGDGNDLVHLYDYKTGQVTMVPEGSDLEQARWYPTMTTLNDGRILVQAGRNANQSSGVFTPEIYTAGVGSSLLTGATSASVYNNAGNLYDVGWWYPRSWVAPDGRVFGISQEDMYYIDANANGGNGSITQVGTFPGNNKGYSSTAVMYAPGKIMQVGGDIYGNSKDATIIDINGGTPVLSSAGQSNYHRIWSDSTVLPDGKVLVSGGGNEDNDPNGEIHYAAEIWDPATNTWTIVDNAATPRLYHSTSLLLPDGRVLTAGGTTPTLDSAALSAEIYSPAYLFANDGSPAVRPIITEGDTTFDWGSNISITVDNNQPVDRVTLVGFGAVTHSFDMGQRFMELSFTQTGGQLTVEAPDSANDAPPGYYMLFVHRDGVPSEAQIVSVCNC